MWPPLQRSLNRVSRAALLLGLLPCSLLSSLDAADASKLPPPATGSIDFVRDVQSIFEAKCHSCHGDKKQESGLRLTDRDEALKGGEHGPILIPGKSAESLIVEVVSGLHRELPQMPKKGDPLTAEEIGLLRAWIDQGADWPLTASAGTRKGDGHWAFKPPVKPKPPQVVNAAWVRNDIDRFTLARLEKDNLKPAPEAAPSALIRRLSLDLIGLPPTPSDVDAYLADKSLDAFDKQVDRLLTSPRYGERWGRHWLDAARYADSNGYEKDARRHIWPYRDWVIKAFQDDLPFDEFTIYQLAGDLLPGASVEHRVATGFLRNSMMNQEGGIEPEQFRIEAMIDRMDAVGKAWLGLSIACAQCHNHKYDPISQREYYQVFALLNNDDEPFVEVPTAKTQKQREAIRTRARQIADEAMRDTPNLRRRMGEWEKDVAQTEGDWAVLEPKEWLNFATKYEKQSDGSLLGGGDVKPGAVTHVWVETPLTQITGFRIEALNHPNLPYGGPGLIGSGSFLLREFTCEAYPLNNPTVTNKVEFRRALADAEAPGLSITNAIDGELEKSGWAGPLNPGRSHEERRAVFECATPIGFPGGTRLKFTLHQRHSSGDGHSGELDKETKLDSHAFGRFRLSVTTQPIPLRVDPLAPPQRKLLAIAANRRTPDQTRQLFQAFRLSDSSFAALNDQIDRVWTNWPSADKSLALTARAEPRQAHIFKRGDWQRPGEAVEPGVPAVLHPFPDGEPRNRLGFARWLVDRRSPTTARVIVNRIWQSYFGQGLVTTPEDFGTRVESPSHPELLDWLACEFMERGWSFKAMHRLIAGSATYRQSSKVLPEIYSLDPYNRLLARGPRFRVEAEIIQDIALAAGGLLSPKIGGPSVYPPIPGNLGDTVYGGFSWPESQGEDRYRRGMYTFWKRSAPFPALLAFDAPPAENSCTRRSRSNTPLQALTTLNEQTYVEAAKAMGLRVLTEGGPDERSRAIYAFRLATARVPSERELELVLKFWREQYQYFEDRTAAAVQMASRSITNLPPDVNLHKVAAWAMVSRAILNLDETMTKE